MSSKTTVWFWMVAIAAIACVLAPAGGIPACTGISLAHATETHSVHESARRPDDASVGLRYVTDASGAASSTSPALTSSGGSQVMQIKFRKSGGFAGMPGLDVEGTIDLGDETAAVVSASGNYRRTLASPETALLRTAADPKEVSQARRAVASQSRKIYDGYQYDITVVTKDGGTQTVTLSAAGGGDELNQLAPGLGNLVQWIDNEAQRIKEHRLKNR